MIRRVLIPLDGSEMAESLLTRLWFLNNKSDVEVILMAGVDPRQPVDLLGTPVVVELANKAKAYLGEVAERVRAVGNEVSIHVEQKQPADAIIAAANNFDAHVICMSTHGRSGVSRVVYGSVTERVVRASERPVLVVPSFARTSTDGNVDQQEWKFRSIVVALDGSREAMQIVPFVAEAKALFQSKVSLLLVVDKGAPQKALDDAEEHLKGAVGLFAKGGVEDVQTVIRHGDPASEIVSFASHSNHDAIMMTTRGRTGLKRLALGSVAEEVLRTATVPVAVVRSRTDE